MNSNMNGQKKKEKKKREKKRGVEHSPLNYCLCWLCLCQCVVVCCVCARVHAVIEWKKCFVFAFVQVLFSTFNTEAIFCLRFSSSRFFRCKCIVHKCAWKSAKKGKTRSSNRFVAIEDQQFMRRNVLFDICLSQPFLPYTFLQ